MITSDTVRARRRDRQELPARWPVVIPLALFGLALLLRIIDIYVLRLDERIGEIILSKSLGFALVLGYTWWIGQRLSAIGLHTRRLGSALAIGAGLTGAALVIATVAQVLTIAHFLNNTTLNLVQVQAAGGELQPATVMSVVVVVALALLALTVEPLARRLALPHLRPWGAGNETGAMS